MQAGVGLQDGGRSLPVGCQPPMHRCQSTISAAPAFIKGSDQGFAGLGAQGRPPGAISGSDRADGEHTEDSAVPAQISQPAITDQLGSQGRPLADALVRTMALQEFRGRQPQHRIAQKFQAFVVDRSTGGRVGERLVNRGQVAIAWRQAKAFQEGNELGATIRSHGRDGAARGGWVEPGGKGTAGACRQGGRCPGCRRGSGWTELLAGSLGKGGSRT